jgi:hypothetical protein
MYVSHTPCGDASIFPLSNDLVQTKNKNNNMIAEPAPPILTNEEEDQHPHKRLKLSSDEVQPELVDIQRTGARAVPGEQQDSVSILFL